MLDDGGETDLDLGNYERFLDISLGGMCACACVCVRACACSSTYRSVLVNE